MAFKHLTRAEMEQLPEAELADYIWREDAAEAIRDGFTREQHISCYKPDVQHKAAVAWDEVANGPDDLALHHP